MLREKDEKAKQTPQPTLALDKHFQEGPAFQKGRIKGFIAAFSYICIIILFSYSVHTLPSPAHRGWFLSSLSTFISLVLYYPP